MGDKSALHTPLHTCNGRNNSAEPLFPPVVRGPGERAVLVSERSAVWDKPSAAVVPADAAPEVTDPAWDHQGGTVWTPDLVHCRLLVVGEITLRMPGSLKRSLVSFLGNLVVSDNAVARRAPLTPQEITLADWTWAALIKLPLVRFNILQARAFGVSYDKITEAMHERGRRESKTTVKRWEMADRRRLATDWQEARHGVDALSFERWREIFVRVK